MLIRNLKVESEFIVGVWKIINWIIEEVYILSIWIKGIIVDSCFKLNGGEVIVVVVI